MNSKKILSCGALVFGILVFVIGSVFVVMYVGQAILARLGEPDQSLLFWYLPFLFIGIIGIGLGIGMGVLGVIGWQRIRSQEEHERIDALPNAQIGEK
jgi:hypothetical protein